MTDATVDRPLNTVPRSPAVIGLAWGFILFSVATRALLMLPLTPGDTLSTTLGVQAGSGGLTGGVAWAGWKLTTPAVHAEFERMPVAAEG